MSCFHRRRPQRWDIEPVSLSPWPGTRGPGILKSNQAFSFFNYLVYHCLNPACPVQNALHIFIFRPAKPPGLKDIFCKALIVKSRGHSSIGTDSDPIRKCTSTEANEAGQEPGTAQWQTFSQQGDTVGWQSLGIKEGSEYSLRTLLCFALATFCVIF